MDYREIPAFCINLDSRPDRWEQAQEEFAKLDWPIIRWSAARVESTPWAKSMAPGALGCLASHKQLWQHCLCEQLGVIAVFEDDVVFPSSFKDIFSRAYAELPADWDVWHLHSTQAHAVHFSEHLVRITGKMWGTHGYLISEPGCEKLLALPDTEPADYRMSESFCRYSDRVYGSRLECALAFQRGDDSDIPATAQVDFWRRQRARYCR